jgi:hypothetical protein
MPTATAGVQSTLDVEASPVIGSSSSMIGQPATWTWIWFGAAILVIIGFHVRVFGRAVPPAAQFP